MVERKVGQFSTAKPAAKQKCQNRSIPFCFLAFRRSGAATGSGLFRG